MISNRLEEIMSQWSKQHNQKLTWRALAQAAGVSYHYLYGQFKRRSSEIDLNLLDKVCEVLGVTPNEILVYTPNPQPSTRPIQQPSRRPGRPSKSKSTQSRAPSEATH
jgi:DNA-binding Xre family transcriptional regulator